MAKKVPLILGFEGLTLDRDTCDHLLEVNPWGVILFKRNLRDLEQAKALVGELKALLGPILVSIDHEGGLVNRFGPQFPVPPAAFGLHFRPKAELRQAAQMLAALPAALGFNLNFAPVLDLYHPGSKAIGTRAFHSDPAPVADWGRLVVEAHEQVGVASTAKHFPGHGRVTQDSHFEIGRLDSDLAELEALDLQAFAGLTAPLVMTSHLYYPALDPELPASLSRKIVTGLLREKLGYSGLVVSDCVEMEGLARNFSPQEMVELGIRAGLDLWISSFSLKKSRPFQLQLAQALRDQGQEGDHPKIEGLIQRYRPHQVSLPPVEEAVALRQRLIQKTGILPPGPWDLVEMENAVFTGANLGEAQGGFLAQMKQGHSEIKGTWGFSLSDPKSWTEFFQSRTSQGRSLLLATKNARFHPQGAKLAEGAASLPGILHLDLGDGADMLSPEVPKWNVFGSDPLTVQAICRELKQGANRG